MDTVAQRVDAKRVEIERLFRVVTSAVAAYEEIPAAVSVEVTPVGVVEIKRVYMDVVDSSGITPAGHYSESKKEYPTDPEIAFAAWSHHMDAYLASHPERERLFWRCVPELEYDRGHEAKVKRWNVRSRLGII